MKSMIQGLFAASLLLFLQAMPAGDEIFHQLQV